MPKKNFQPPKNINLNQAHYFLFFLIIFALITCYNIIKPYINAIVFAIILSSIFHTSYKKIEKIVKGRSNLAAFISCVLLTLVVLLPLLFLLIALIQQGITTFNTIYEWIAAGKHQKIFEIPWIISAIDMANAYLPDIEKYFPKINIDSFNFNSIMLKVTTHVGQFLLNQSSNILGDVTTFIGKFFLMIFAFFFIIRDYEKITRAIFHLIPLSATQEKKIIQNIQAVSKSVILGTLITGAAQGAAGGIAFWITGLPGLFWGTMMAFSSLVPLVGTALIWLPASLYLLISGHWGYCIFMILWCLIIVGMIDNFVRPLFMQGASDMSTLIIFFSILGGINYFGLAGLLYGPLIFGTTMVLLYIYKLEFNSFLKHQDKS